jgi:hypothetical protein
MKTLNIEIPEGYEIDQEKSTFETIVFKKKTETLPKTWGELEVLNGYFINEYSILSQAISCSTINQNKNIFATEEQAQASTALAQLSQLRKVYRNGWEPDWTDGNGKAYIYFDGDGNDIQVAYNSTTTNFLSIQSYAPSQSFLKNFRDLIEQAKPLMS